MTKIIPSDRAPRTRDMSIDVLRGLVMCLMVLDHVRDYFTSPLFSPTDAAKTSAALFFTRFITHYCAPVFVLLAGTGAGISRANGKPRSELARFLVSRGLWLVLLEMTWVRFGWLFELSYERTPAQVIWALGWCMVVLAALVFLPRSIVAAMGLILIVGHNAFDGVTVERFGHARWLWRVLHQGGPIELDATHAIYIAYPLVPWIGVMALGYVLGTAWARIDRRALTAAGLLCCALFAALRTSNAYGDPHAFVALGGARTMFSLLDCMKYPPSLDYLLVTLGPALLVLGLLHGRALDGPVGSTLELFGRVPLFFYLLHVPLVHALSLPLRYVRGLPLIASGFHHGLDVSLLVVYVVTLATIAILYWPCRKWAALKRARRDWWLSYL